MNTGKPRSVRCGALIALALLFLASCAGSPHIGGAAGLQLIARDQLPAPTIEDLGVSQRPYRVGPLDKLSIDVFGAEELSGKEIQVDASGRIAFPLLGTFEVGGKTPDEIAGIMQNRLRERRIIREPSVTVNLKEIVSQTVTVGGEVREPGVYPVVGRVTLARVIATAKGTTEYSKKSEVLVFRTVNEQKYAALYDLKSIERGVYEDPEIYANDVVMVGDSSARRLFRDILQTSPLLVPVIYLLR